MRELGLDVIVEHREPVRFQALDVLVQRVHEDREGRLRSSSDADPERTRWPRAPRERRAPRAAASCRSRLTDDLDRGRAALIELREHLLERAELFGAPDEVVRTQGHSRPG